MGVGNEIARVRKARGLKQLELAERVPIRPSYLSEVESEKKSASFDTIIRIANALDVSLDVLAEKELSEAASFLEADKATRYCKEDSLIRKSVLMMGLLDEHEKFKIFTYIQERMEISHIKNQQGH